MRGSDETTTGAEAPDVVAGRHRQRHRHSRRHSLRSGAREDAEEAHEPPQRCYLTVARCELYKWRMRLFYPAKIDAEFPSVRAALEDLGLAPDEARLIIDHAATEQTRDLLIDFKDKAYAVTRIAESRAVRWRAYFEYRQESREEAWRAAEQIGISGGRDQGWAIFTWETPPEAPRVHVSPALKTAG